MLADGKQKRIRTFLSIAGDKGVEVLRLHINTGKFFKWILVKILACVLKR